MITPKEITKDQDTGKEYASFSYYDGIEYCDKKGIKQNVAQDFHAGKSFIVTCGDVMICVKPTEFPEIERRII